MTVRGDIVFPLDIAEGAKGGPRFKTTINEVASGYEYRNIDWSKQRCEYDVSFGVRTNAQAKAVLDLFYASRGKAYGFLFYDWADHSIGTAAAPQALGTGTSFQLFKRYTVGSYYYDRIITRPSVTDAVVTVGGTPTTSYTLNTTTGVLTVPAGGAVAIYLPTFYVPVRFDQDDLGQVIIRPDIIETPSIMLVEIKE